MTIELWSSPESPSNILSQPETTGYTFEVGLPRFDDVRYEEPLQYDVSALVSGPDAPEIRFTVLPQRVEIPQESYLDVPQPSRRRSSHDDEDTSSFIWSKDTGLSRQQTNTSCDFEEAQDPDLSNVASHIMNPANRLALIHQGYKEIHKHRSRMSYRWQLFSENLAYVNEDRNELSSLVARLQQEMQQDPINPQAYNSDKVNGILLKISERSSDLSKAEAKLDAIKDTINEEELRLRLAEKKLQQYFPKELVAEQVDDLDNLFDTNDILFDVDRSLQQDSSTNIISEHQDQDLHVPSPDQTSSPSEPAPEVRVKPPSQAGSSNFIRNVVDGIASPTINISSRVPFFGIDTDYSTGQVAKRPTSRESSLKPVTDTDITFVWTGIQFADVDVFPDDSLLSATEDQWHKRESDLDSVIEQADTAVDEDVDYVPSVSSRLQSSVVDSMWFIFRKSWLEFSRFLHQLQVHGTDYRYLKKLDFLSIDKLLKQIASGRGMVQAQGNDQRDTSDHTGRLTGSMRQLPPYSTGQMEGISVRTSATQRFARKGHPHRRNDDNNKTRIDNTSHGMGTTNSTPSNDAFSRSSLALRTKRTSFIRASSLPNRSRNSNAFRKSSFH